MSNYKVCDLAGSRRCAARVRMCIQSYTKETVTSVRCFIQLNSSDIINYVKHYRK